MPSAPQELRDKFDGPEDAWKVLERFCVNDQGIIRPRTDADVLLVKEDAELRAAVDYLWLEWDYGYMPFPTYEAWADRSAKATNR